MPDGDDLDAMLRKALARVSVKDAVGEVALATGRSRREVYQRALELEERAMTRAPKPKPLQPRPERQKREARPEKIAAFGLGISAESRRRLADARMAIASWAALQIADGEIDIIAARRTR